MRRVLLAAGVVAAPAAAACGDDAVTPIDAPVDAVVVCVAGDPSRPPELQLITLGQDGVQRPLVDGGEIDIVRPPQGGQVVFVGVRITNVELCGADPPVTIQAALRDRCSSRVIGIERRPITWALGADGFAEPAQPLWISDYANVAVCPNAATMHDVDGHPYQLEVRFYPPASAPAIERVITVTPTCLDDEDCRCECDADYRLGEPCPVDPDGGIECP